MMGFSAGEHVIIRYGRRQGQKATIIKSQPGDAYRVKAEDGTVLFFSGKGLEKEEERVQKSHVVKVRTRFSSVTT